MKKLLSILTICLGIGSSFGATFTVTNLNDAGAGSLRQAINDASNSAGADNIVFNGISGVINLNSGLEIWDHEVFIDGSTAAGYTPGNPTIILRLTNTGVDILGVKSNGSSGSRVHALHFQGGRKAIELWQVTGVTISGCWFGLTTDGTATINSPLIYEEAININNADDNFIGLPGEANRNIIGRTDIFETTDGNGDRGRGINLYQSDGNTIANNYLGTNKDGWDNGGNTRFVVGIYLNESSNNTIGSSTSRSGRNIVGNAAQDGIAIAKFSNNNNVFGNFVGLSKDGTTAIPCRRHGIIYRENSAGGFVGGASEIARNIAANSGNNGLSIDNASGLTIINNYSGTDTTGTLDYGNGWSGLSFTAGSNCTINGNLFSGNTNEGVWMGVGTNDIRFYNNIIGLNATGTATLQNDKQGIMISEWGGICNAITIGQSSQGNVISGNGEEGIKAERCAELVVKSNIIGLNSSGDAAIGNGDQGLEIIGTESNEAIIGGFTADEGNIISGNNQNGIYTTSHYLEIHHNKIGTDLTGTTHIGNGRSGIQLASSNRNNISNNTISGNTRHGMELTGSNLNIITSNTLSGNSMNGANLSNTSARNEFTFNSFESNINGIQISDANSSRNFIKESSFSCNSSKGINLNGTYLIGLGNDRKPTPTIASNSYSGSLFGTAEANDSVDVYIVSDCDTNSVCSQTVKKQGMTYVGSVQADGNGFWTYPSTRDTKYYTVASRDADNNTSEFAVCDCFDPTWDITSTDAEDCDALNGEIKVTTTSFGGLVSGLIGSLTYNSPTGTVVKELDTDSTSSWVLDSLVPGTYSNIQIDYLGCSYTEPTTFTIGGTAFTTGSLSFDSDILCYDDQLSATFDASSAYTVSFYDSIPGGSWREITDGTVSTNSITYSTDIDFDTTLYIQAFVEDGGICSGFTAIDSMTLYCPCIDPLLTSSFEDATNCDGSNGAFTLNKTNGQTFHTDSTYWVTFEYGGVIDSMIAAIATATSITLSPLEQGTYSQITLKEYRCNWTLGSDITIGGDVLTGTTISTDQNQVCIGDTLTITHDINDPFSITWYDSTSTQDWSIISIGTSTDGSFDYPITTEHEGDIYIRAHIQNNDCDEYSNTIAVNNYCPCRDPEFSLASNNTTDCEASNGSITITKHNKEPFLAINDYWVWYTLNNEEDSIQGTVTSDTTINLSPLTKGSYSDLILAGPLCTWSLSGPINIGGDVLGNIDITTAQDQVCNGDSLTITHGITAPFTLVWYDSTSNRGWEEITNGVTSEGTFTYPIISAYNGNIYVRALVESMDCNQFTNTLTVNNYCPCKEFSFDFDGQDADDCDATEGIITIKKTDRHPFIPGLEYDLEYNSSTGKTFINLNAQSDSTIVVSNLKPDTYDQFIITSSLCTWEIDSSVLIQGEPFSTAGISSNQDSVCNGDSLFIYYPNSTGYTIEWQLTQNGQNNLITVEQLAADTFLFIPQNVEDIYTISAIANEAGCTHTTNSISVRSFCPCAMPEWTTISSNTDDCFATNGAITITEITEHLETETSYAVSYSYNKERQTKVLVFNTDHTFEMIGLTPGTYDSIEVFDGRCTHLVAEKVEINGKAFSAGSITAPQTVCTDDSVEVAYSLTNFHQVTWYDSSNVADWKAIVNLNPNDDSLLFDPTLEETVIHVRALVDSAGCLDTTNSVAIWIDLCLPDPVIFIPNIFTPNNDGTHDVLNITDIDRFEDYTMEVYNRWGSLVYESSAPYEPWNGQFNGKQLPFGVYYYILNIHDTDEQFAGHVTIMY